MKDTSNQSGSQTRPKYLYKYMSMQASARGGKNKREWVRQILRDGKLFFSSPALFNDPFDSEPLVSIDATDEEWTRYFEYQCKDRDPHAPRPERRRRLKKYRKAVDTKQKRKDVLGSMKKTVTDMVKETGIFCLSESSAHIMMWAHYADSHKGICLRFNTSNETFFKKTHKVNYTDERPTSNLVTTRPDTKKGRDYADYMLLTKAQCWAYEKEWRLIEKYHGVYDLPKDAVDGIILGAKIDAEAEQELREWLVDRNIEFYKARLCDKQFRVVIDPKMHAIRIRQNGS